MNIRAYVVVSGRVQGVSFRHYTCRRAQDLGVVGWVRNLPDGSVEGMFEGEEPAVRALVEWCRSGPPSARVDQVEEHAGDYTGEFDDFRIRY
jgi:acylphosphatase